jgi:CheY-like chemotaxis protein
MAERVAILNSNDQIIESLRETLEDAGYLVSTAHVPDIQRGRQDLLDFLRKHDPEVIVYDIPPPYEENWRFLQLVRDTGAMAGRKIVLTTTNKEALLRLVDAGEVHEILGKPTDLLHIADAVRSALASTKQR